MADIDVRVVDRVPGRFGPGRWRWRAVERRVLHRSRRSCGGRWGESVSDGQDEPAIPALIPPDAGPVESVARCFGSADWVRTTQWVREGDRASPPRHHHELRLRIDRSPVPLAWPVSLTVGSMSEAASAIDALQRLRPVEPPAEDPPVLLTGGALAQVPALTSEAALPPAVNPAGDGLLFASLEPVADDQGDGVAALLGVPAVLRGGEPVGYVDGAWLLFGNTGARGRAVVVSGPWWSALTVLQSTGLRATPL